MRTQSGDSIDQISGTDGAERSVPSETTAVRPPTATEAAYEAPHSPKNAASGVNGVAGTPSAQTNTADEGALKEGKSRAQHMRRYSTGEDFEASAGPRGKDGYGDADDMRHVGAGSRFYDPRKDVVLRIECATDAQTRVSPGGSVCAILKGASIVTGHELCDTVAKETHARRTLYIQAHIKLVRPDLRRRQRLFLRGCARTSASRCSSYRSSSSSASLTGVHRCSARCFRSFMSLCIHPSAADSCQTTSAAL